MLALRAAFSCNKKKWRDTVKVDPILKPSAKFSLLTIVEKLENNLKTVQHLLFVDGKKEYTLADLDDVREDWASYVVNFVI